MTDTTEKNSSEKQPAKASKGVSLSLTDLLKQNELKISTVRANKLLLEKGILAEAERVSAVSDKVKKYKVLTETGLQYGENRESAHSDQTSPYYYQATFPELARIFEEFIASEKK